jgi:hypothetical protein
MPKLIIGQVAAFWILCLMAGFMNGFHGFDFLKIDLQFMKAGRGFG